MKLYDPEEDAPKTYGEVVADLIEELVREIVSDMRDDHHIYDVPEIKSRLVKALNGEAQE